jgi:hypothetical protein
MMNVTMPSVVLLNVVAPVGQMQVSTVLTGNC